MPKKMIVSRKQVVKPKAKLTRKKSVNPLDNVRKLVIALRSGKYRQATGYLRQDGKFCCLGVACDLYRKDRPGTRWTMEGDIGVFLREECSLPDEVSRWLKWNRKRQSENPIVDGHSLSDWNDGDVWENGIQQPKKTFREIADLIEKKMYKGKLFARGR